MKCRVHYERDHPRSAILDLPIGANLHGLRMSWIAFENQEEIVALTANPEYLKTIRNAMLTKDQQIARKIIPDGN